MKATVAALLIAAASAAQAGPAEVYLKCKLAPSSEYTIRIDPKAEVMWVHGTRLKLQETATEYIAMEYPGEPKELKAEYRINRKSNVLRRTSYGLNGATGTREGPCRKTEPPSAAKSQYW